MGLEVGLSDEKGNMAYEALEEKQGAAKKKGRTLQVSDAIELVEAAVQPRQSQ